MKLTRRVFKKTYEVSKDGRIVVYPSLHHVQEKGNLRHILRILKRLKKGH